MQQEKENTFGKINLQAEIDRLQKLLFFKDQQIRELQREVNDYALREEKLIAELKLLTAELSNAKFPMLFGIQGSVEPPTKEDFLNPKLDTGTGLNRASEGLEKNWGEMMFAYTDEIFVEEDTPDTVLLRDEDNGWYITPSGRTRLPFPILQTDLDNLNILKVREATEQEINDFIKENNL